jgi:hypothetical protein
MTWSEIPWRPTTRTLRQFAVLWLLFVGLLAWRFGFQRGDATWGGVLAATAGLVGVGGLVWPLLVRPLFLALTVVTLPLGWILSRLLLAILFYGLFTPIGLVFRLFGRDALQLRQPTNGTTYWQPKVTADDPRRYLQAF